MYGLKAISLSTDSSIFIYSTPGTPFPPVRFYDPATSRGMVDSNKAYESQLAYMDFIKNTSKPGDIVVIFD